jgi:hypothetical protein
LALSSGLTVADLLATWSNAQLRQFMLNAPALIYERKVYRCAGLRSLLQSSCAEDFQQAVSHWLPFAPSQPISTEMAETDDLPMAVQRDNKKGASQQQEKRDRKWPDLHAFAKQSKKKQSSSGMVIRESVSGIGMSSANVKKYCCWSIVFCSFYFIQENHVSMSR